MTPRLQNLRTDRTLRHDIVQAEVDGSHEREVSRRRQDLELYGGLLHHTAAVAAVIIFGGVCAFGLPPQDPPLPLLASLVLLVCYFGIASWTYRSEIFSGLCLLAVGLVSFHLAAFANSVWPTSGVHFPPAVASLGLILVVIASVLTRKAQSPGGENEHAFWLASPWSRPFPWSADTKLAVWLRPLRTASILYAGAALILLLIAPLRDGTWQQLPIAILLTLCLVAATFALAARLYQQSLLTYLAATVIATSTAPLLLVLDQPATHLGIALSLVAMLFWLAGFVVERYVSIRDAGLEPSASPLTRLYEKPLIRCSTVLATIAIAHSLVVWNLEGWLAAQYPLVAACALGAITLMLNARSLNVLHRVTPRARWCISPVHRSPAVCSASPS